MKMSLYIKSKNTYYENISKITKIEKYFLFYYYINILFYSYKNNFLSKKF